MYNRLELLETIKKQDDTKLFIVKLFDDKAVYEIPNEAVVKLVVAKKGKILVNKVINVVNHKEGLVEFDINEYIGEGFFECEVIVLHGDTHKTFPEEGYFVLKIVPNLKGDAETILPTEYEVISNRINFLEAKVAGVDFEVFATKEGVIEGLATKTDIGHTHEMEEVIGLLERLVEIENVLKTKANKIEVENALEQKSNVGHTHEISDINKLQTQLDTKTNIGHKHEIPDIDGLNNKLSELSTADNTLRNNLNSLNSRIGSVDTSLKNKISTTESSLNAKINAVEDSLEKEIKLTEGNLDSKINSSVYTLNKSIGNVNNNLNTSITALDETLTDLQEEVANIQLSGVTGEFEVLTTEEIETMWKNINDK